MFICAHCHNAIAVSAVFHFGKAYHDDCFVTISQPDNSPIPTPSHPARRGWTDEEIRKVVAEELGKRLQKPNKWVTVEE